MLNQYLNNNVLIKINLKYFELLKKIPNIDSKFQKQLTFIGKLISDGENVHHVFVVVSLISIRDTRRWVTIASHKTQSCRNSGNTSMNVLRIS